MADWKDAELTIGAAKFNLRFVSQRRRNELSNKATPRGGEFNHDTFSDLYAREAITGWSNLTPVDCLGFGYEDFEALPVDEHGCVPFSPDTASLLYRECLMASFRNPVDAAVNAIAAEVAQAKKRLAA